MQIVFIAIILTYYATRLSLFLYAYKDQGHFVNENLRAFPDNFACWTWLGLEKQEKGYTYGALEAFYEGLKIRPNDFRLNYNAAWILLKLGYLDDAIKFLEKAKISALPETVEVKIISKIDEDLKKALEVKEKSEINYRNRIIDEYKRLKRVI